MLGQEEGHMHLTSVLLLPLVTLVVLRALEGSVSGRGLILRLGLVLGFREPAARADAGRLRVIGDQSAFRLSRGPAQSAGADEAGADRPKFGVLDQRAFPRQQRRSTTFCRSVSRSMSRLQRRS